MPALYRAIVRGQTPDGTWWQAGETFTTDAPQGKWMELLEADPLDHDGDGKKGGSKAKAKPAPSEADD